MKAKQTLYDIGDDLWAIDELLEESEGDVTGQEEALDALIEESLSDLNTKFTGYRKLMVHLESLAEEAKTESKRLAEIARVRQNKVDRLKGRLYQFMTAHNIDKVETPLGTFAIQNNGGALPVEIDEYLLEHPEELPEGYRIVEFKPDKRAIGQALKDGESLDFARYGERGTHLRIK